MRTNKYLVDNNILFTHPRVPASCSLLSALCSMPYAPCSIHHTQGLKKAGDFINSLAARNALNISILTKVEKLPKLADSVIAATAIIHDLKLATRNVDDFKEIPGLEVENIIG